MLKQAAPMSNTGGAVQPPSGGCVLKPRLMTAIAYLIAQPPSGGCVLKPRLMTAIAYLIAQPPSGGCVLKHSPQNFQALPPAPAAFRRLCVETPSAARKKNPKHQPPSGGCVLKPDGARAEYDHAAASRLQAAVC